MKKTILISMTTAILLSGCTSLTRQEEMQIQQLKAQGVTVDKPIGNYEKPASIAGAAALNVLPGFGNFYLGSGNAAESSHWLYGLLNLLTWPISIVWAIPEAGIDANTINKREMLYYYTYDKHGKRELEEAGIKLD